MNIMNNSLLKVSLKWAGIYTAYSILVFLLMYVFTFKPGMFTGILMFLVLIAVTILIFVYSNKEYGNSYLGGYISYWQCLLNSALVYAFGTIFYSLFQYIFYTLIDPKAFDELIQMQIAMIDSNPNFPASLKEETLMKILELTPLKLSLSQLWYIIFGIVLALIVSIFTRKKNNSFEGTFKEVE